MSRDRLYSLCDIELSLPGRTCAKAFISVLHVMGLYFVSFFIKLI